MNTACLTLRSEQSIIYKTPHLRQLVSHSFKPFQGQVAPIIKQQGDLESQAQKCCVFEKVQESSLPVVGVLNLRAPQCIRYYLYKAASGPVIAPRLDALLFN
jgi:hypothetical protein